MTTKRNPPPRRPLSSGLPASLLLLAACAAAPPPAPPAPVVVAPPAPPTAAPPDDSSVAEERIAAWERNLWAKARPRKQRRQTLGRFVASYFETGPFGDRFGAVATKEGIVERVLWEKLVSADRDVDGDGRVDLLAAVQGDDLVPPERTHRWKVAFVADRTGGPAMLSVEGAEPHAWEIFEWTDAPAPTLSTRLSPAGYGRQVLAWNGKAMVATETELLRWEHDDTQFGQSCTLEAIAAGKTLRWGRDAPCFIEDQRPDDGGLVDLRGDGPRFYVFRHIRPPTGEGSSATKTHVILELRKEGWVLLSTPDIDIRTGNDRDRNQVPDYECSLGNIDLAKCASGMDECEPFEVTALATWDGAELTNRTPALRSVYEAWLKAARDEASALAARGRSTECPRDHLITAGKLYLASRWSDVAEARAEAEVNRLMNGVSLAACAGSGMTARSWPAVWKDMKRYLHWALPQATSTPKKAK